MVHGSLAKDVRLKKSSLLMIFISLNILQAKKCVNVHLS